MQHPTGVRLSDEYYKKCIISPKVTVEETTEALELRKECTRARASELQLAKEVADLTRERDLATEKLNSVNEELGNIEYEIEHGNAMEALLSLKDIRKCLNDFMLSLENK